MKPDRAPAPSLEKAMPEQLDALLGGEDWVREAYERIERIRDFVRMVTEWTAKFPLKGEGSIPDNAAATELYCCCEGAEENLCELAAIIRKHHAGGKQ